MATTVRRRIARLMRRGRPLVSVAMTSFNHAAFVTAAIESVLSQTLKDLELIVVDDGSTDQTPDLIAQFSDPRIKFIRLSPNRATHARNCAIRACAGEYIAFQNSDDIWHPRKLKKQIRRMEHDKEISACFTAATIIDANGRKNKDTWAEGIFRDQGRDRNAWLRFFFYQGNCLCFPSAVIRRQCLSMVGLERESLVQLPDCDLWVRLAAIGNLIVVDQTLTQFRVHGANVSSPSPSNMRRHAVERVEVLMRYVQPLLLEQSERIFPELALGQLDDTLKKAALARHASSHPSPQLRLFADRVWQELFDDYRSRRRIFDFFGPTMFQDFLTNRGT